MKLILASSSPYRRRILEQLRLPFSTCSPDIDEQPKTGENTREYVSRLALAKAEAVAADYDNALIIASDQACTLNGLILGKPHTEEAAFKHLKMCRNNWVQFETGIALLNTATGKQHVAVEPYRVRFRDLGDEEIRAYISLDMPLDCAGCFKIEKAGINLFEELEGRDYNSLLGLPMIVLISMLREEGLNPLLVAAAEES